MDTAAFAAIGSFCREYWVEITCSTIAIGALVELLSPLTEFREGTGSLASKWTANILSSFASNTVLTWMAPLLLQMALGSHLDRSTLPFGQLEKWGGPLPVLFLGLLSLDLYAYWAHRASHSVGLLWKWHSMHHDDEHMDIATAFRHHPLEVIIDGGVFSVLFVGLGTPAWLFPIYAALVQVLGSLKHTNIRISPRWLESGIGLVLFTPKDHHLHHSVDHMRLNLGSVFSIWDRLFGTYAHVQEDERKRIRFGLRHEPAEAHSPAGLMIREFFFPRNLSLIGFAVVVLIFSIQRGS